MASSKTEISNLSFLHLGTAKVVSNIETDQSEEARNAKRFYELAKDIVLKDFNWPFARKKAIALNLVEERPNDEWLYSYRYPSDCLSIKKIFSGIRRDDRQSRVSYELSRDNDGILIFTDQDEAKADYTMREDIINRYPADFVEALSYKLAYYLAPTLTKGDPFKMKKEMEAEYVKAISNAQANAVNEQQDEEKPDAEFIRARNNYNA